MMRIIIFMLLLMSGAALAEEAGKPEVLEKTYDVKALLPIDWKVPDLKVKAAKGAATLTPTRTTPTLDFLADLIHNHVRPETWDPELKTKIESKGASILVVTQSAEMHAQIAAMIELLKEAAAAKIGTVTSEKKPADKNASPKRFELRVYTISSEMNPEIVQALKNAVKKESWDDPQVYAEDFASKSGGIILVNQSAAVHELIKPFLDAAR